ncbi:MULTISPECIES: nitroreductase [unclassified Mycolicibacterium]|uniref:nitroreductase n=1 Tax=unclassified Mycolicibacterium TaxID=2636767 RepID=UPI0012DEE4CF|nr:MULTISPECIES: nitroreductase [unclassified Mycolicibacterium]MUL80625.1 nitroreductase [Mycolicibacterium sp. CBMA 329]MUL86392.1 nitroreductase [Mycolicibacterium sp. CBMA 331]MUM01254.1 nitroreductase [Mycolicibacterium sp. CBMA 334]MUM29013.1 nitroreductase [Mycolicibacterium sp. CBMA 295]MUM36688.1 nitroreductase [Mycolicibacterium sp. CBMA 247]
MTEFGDVVRSRRSSRMFLPDKPVPRELLDEALGLAIRAPSNSNSQPWHVVFATGERRARLVEALLAAVEAAPPAVGTAGLPPRFAHLRRESGAMVYGAMGIARDDAEGRWAAQRRNWQFFGAPVAGVVCMHRDFGNVDAMGVGMFVQTLLLALNERGLGSCVQVSIGFYPDVLREQLGIPDDLTIRCGLSIGYADQAFPANNLDTPRNPISENVVFLDD